LSGGRFGKGVAVTGRTFVMDSPMDTTTYKLETWYPDAEKKTLHAAYSTTVEVLHPTAMGLQTYWDSRGWRLLHPKDWQCDKVSLPDPANNALMYFQPEEDSEDRLAVAILPVSEQSCASLTNKVKADLPSYYDDVQIISAEDTTFEEIPAIITVFSGKDHSHFGA